MNSGHPATPYFRAPSCTQTIHNTYIHNYPNLVDTGLSFQWDCPPQLLKLTTWYWISAVTIVLGSAYIVFLPIYSKGKPHAVGWLCILCIPRLPCLLCLPEYTEIPWARVNYLNKTIVGPNGVHYRGRFTITDCFYHYILLALWLGFLTK